MASLITAASGEEHRAEVLALSESLKKHGWCAKLYPVLDASLGLENEVVTESIGWKGRDLKCKFALFHDLPDNEPVLWVDTDCLATGPEPVWLSLEPNTILTNFWWMLTERTHLPKQLLTRMRNPEGSSGVPVSSIVQFSSFGLARKVCESWYRNLLADREIWEKDTSKLPRGTDEIALYNTIAELKLNVLEFSKSPNGKEQSTYPTLHHPPIG